MTGWGSLSENGPKATRLQKVSVPLIPRQECERRYQQQGYYGPIGEGMLCAGWPQGRRDACQVGRVRKVGRVGRLVSANRG